MRNFYSFTTITILFLCLSTACGQAYRKVIHNTDPEAKCLDGSPGSLYIHEGTEIDKFLIFFNGGGFCGGVTLSDTLQTCYQRSKTDLGSSNKLPETMSGFEGILSLDSSENLYQNWTKVFVNYCDGTLHQGDNESPIQYKDSKLYFRGARIVRSHLKWMINTYKMDQASKIIFSGGSAGAVASTIWGNYLISLVKNPSSVYIIPDSGVFVNAKTYEYDVPLIQILVTNLMSIAHVSEKTPIQQCNKEYPGQEWKCLLNQFNHLFLKGKYLFINSEYDQFAISQILQIDCARPGSTGRTLKTCTAGQMKAIEDYRAQYLSLINDKLRTPDRGIWTIACSQHTYSPYKGFYNVDVQRVPQKTGLNVKQAIQAFVFEDKINWTQDQIAWPLNAPCAY